MNVSGAKGCGADRTMAISTSAAYSRNPEDLQHEYTEFGGPAPSGLLCDSIPDRAETTTMMTRELLAPSSAVERRQWRCSTGDVASHRPAPVDLRVSTTKYHVNEDYIPVSLPPSGCDIVSMLPLYSVSSAIEPTETGSKKVVRQSRDYRPNSSSLIGELCICLKKTEMPAV